MAGNVIASDRLPVPEQAVGRAGAEMLLKKIALGGAPQPSRKLNFATP